jgi:hypothetical protein
MGVGSGTSHDLFVSCARLDDVPLVEDRPGWVTTLVRTVRHLLASKLGRADDLDGWMDHRSLDDLRPFAPEAPDKLRAVAPAAPPP